jgi:putative spermidine/putrescine transport system substrate-binding protein
MSHTLGAAALSLLLTIGLADGVRAETLILNSYGGPYEEIIHRAIIEPFEKTYGIDVIYDAVGSSSQDYAKIKATAGHPGFDVVVMTAAQSLQGCKDGLLERLDPADIPNLAAISPSIGAVAGPCGAVQEVQYLSLLYRTDHLERPSSWNALLANKLKGRIVLPTFQNAMAVDLLQIMSVINGGTMIDDIDPGFAAMAKLASQTVGFEQSSAILQSYITDGTVWAMPFWSGRAELLKDSGAPVDFVRPSEGTIPLIATLNIPVGAEHKAAARKFVNFFLEVSSQEAWVKAYKVGSARNDLDLPEDARHRQITGEADLDSLLLPDLSAVSEHLSKWGQRWEREVVPAAR